MANLIEFPVGIVAPGEMKIPGVDIVTNLHLEPKIPSMGKKLIINAAPTGALMSIKQNPSQPDDLESIAKEAIAAYKAGAAIFHIHCRDQGKFIVDPEEYKKVCDMVYKEAPDMITNICTILAITHEGVETRQRPLIEPLLKYGKKYAEAAVINPVTYTVGSGLPPFIATNAGLKEETAYLESVGVKPRLGGYNLAAMYEMKTQIIDTDICKKPYYYALTIGLHYPSTPATHDLEAFANLMAMVRALPEGSVWEVNTGGRMWLPLAVWAILLGCDAVRVGKEDVLYMYPDRDDLIMNTSDAVTTIANIARALGREIATPAEARKILGIKS
jgi:3-keto-5-aminohexanoate cleavage enzyme